MIAGLSSGELRTRWCGERPGSAFRSRHRSLMDCSLELRTKTPVRMTVDAVYWIELDEEQASPLGEVAAITHGLSEHSFHIETYGTEWPQPARPVSRGRRGEKDRRTEGRREAGLRTGRPRAHELPRVRRGPDPEGLPR